MPGPKPKALSRRAADAPRPDNGRGDPIDTGAIERFFGYALRRAQLQVFQEFGRCTERFDVRPAQFSVMTVVAANPGASQIAIANALAIEPSRMVALLNDLEKRGLAMRAPSKTDRRTHGLFLTRKGETMLAELTGAVEESNRISTAVLTDAERAQLWGLLIRLYRS